MLGFGCGRPLPAPSGYITVQVSVVGVCQSQSFSLFFFFLNYLRDKYTQRNSVALGSNHRRRIAGEGRPVSPTSTYLCAEADRALGAAQMLLDEKLRRPRRSARGCSEKKKD